MVKQIEKYLFLKIGKNLENLRIIWYNRYNKKYVEIINMLEILNEKNIANLIDLFFNVNKYREIDVKKKNLNRSFLYPYIVGYDEKADLSNVDSLKQQYLVDMLSRIINFKQGYAPADGYMSTDAFCRAYSENSSAEESKHRLYFNMGVDRMDFVSLLIRMCEMKNVSYAIKWHKKLNRTDNLVMYVSDKDLENTVDVLEEIITKYPAFAKNSQLPMSTVSGGWFGYGEEKVETNLSYNERISLCVCRAIMRAVNDNREHIDISSVTEFSEFLFEQCCQRLRNKKLASRQELHENSEILKPIFKERSMSLSMNLLFNDEKHNGFCVTENGEDAVAQDKAVMTIYDYKTQKSIDITSFSVMNALLRMVDAGKCEFKLPEEKKPEFVKLVQMYLQKELEKEGVGKMPEILQRIANNNQKISEDESEMM